jgi:plastocyanin
MELSPGAAPPALPPRRTMRRTSLALLVALTALEACSNSTSSTGSDPTPDAPGSPPDATRGDAGPIDAGPIDAAPIDGMPPAATVIAVPCPASPAKAITASDNNDKTYMPSSVTITMGQIVKFTMPGAHDVEPNLTMSDPGLTVNFGETRCLMFSRTGTYGFHCGPHQFTGTVVVQ